ncbi:MAG: hypothetical protein NVSMB13_04810 [Mycobacteriales bacterium]
MRTKTRRLLVAAAVLPALMGAVGTATYSAFSSTTVNAGNSLAAGTVYISDNSAGTAMYVASNKKPADVVQSCIKVTYTGTLAADVHLYTTSAVNALAQYVDLTVDKGTYSGPVPAFPSCAGFVADGGGPAYAGSLSGFATAKNSYLAGIPVYPGAQTTWNQNDTSVFRFTLTVQDNNAANGGSGGPLSTGSHAFTWEAHNQ